MAEPMPGVGAQTPGEGGRPGEYRGGAGHRLRGQQHIRGSSQGGEDQYRGQYIYILRKT